MTYAKASFLASSPLELALKYILPGPYSLKLHFYYAEPPVQVFLFLSFTLHEHNKFSESGCAAPAARERAPQIGD